MASRLIPISLLLCVTLAWGQAEVGVWMDLVPGASVEKYDIVVAKHATEIRRAWAEMLGRCTWTGLACPPRVQKAWMTLWVTTAGQPTDAEIDTFWVTYIETSLLLKQLAMQGTDWRSWPWTTEEEDKLMILPVPLVSPAEVDEMRPNVPAQQATGRKFPKQLNYAQHAAQLGLTPEDIALAETPNKSLPEKAAKRAKERVTQVSPIFIGGTP